MTVTLLTQEGAWLRFPGTPGVVRAKLTANVEVEGLPYEVVAIVLVDSVTGLPAVDALSLQRQPGGPPIQSSNLRKLPPGDIAKAVFEQALTKATTTTHGDVERMTIDLIGGPPEGGPALARQVERSRRERGRHGETVRLAAAAYKAAEAGSDPIEAVRVALNCSKSYAKSLISEARNSPAHLLSPLPRRRTRAEVLEAFVEEWTNSASAGEHPSSQVVARNLGRSVAYVEGLLTDAREAGFLLGEDGEPGEVIPSKEEQS